MGFPSNPSLWNIFFGMSGGDAFWRSFALRSCRYAETHHIREKQQLDYLKERMELLVDSSVFKMCKGCQIPYERTELNRDRNAVCCNCCNALVFCARKFCEPPVKCERCGTPVKCERCGTKVNSTVCQ